MKINEEIVKGKWLEIKGEVQKTWGKLTSSELDKTSGDLKSIAGLVMQKYGEKQVHFEEKFSKILAPFRAKKDAAVKTVKEKLKS